MEISSPHVLTVLLLSLIVTFSVTPILTTLVIIAVLDSGSPTLFFGSPMTSILTYYLIYLLMVFLSPVSVNCMRALCLFHSQVPTMVLGFSPIRRRQLRVEAI